MMIATHQFLTDRPKIEYYGWQLDFPPGVSKINMYDRSHNITSHQNTSPPCFNFREKAILPHILCSHFVTYYVERIFVDIGMATNKDTPEDMNASLRNECCPYWANT